MANLVEDGNVVSPELWRVWQAKGRKHDRASARRYRLVAGVTIGLLALFIVCYLTVVR
jgi:hypothetical protein